MNIGILASNYKFLKEFKDDESFNKYLNSLDIIFLIGYKGFKLFNKNIVDKKKIVIVIKTVTKPFETYNIKNYEKSINYEFKKVLKNGFFLFGLNYRIQDLDGTSMRKKLTKKWKPQLRKKRKLYPNAEKMYVDKNLNDKYTKLFTNGIVLTGHLCILHCISKYPKENINLIGFDYGQQFVEVIDDGFKQKEITTHHHDYNTNQTLLYDLLKSFNNLKIINEF